MAEEEPEEIDDNPEEDEDIDLDDELDDDDLDPDLDDDDVLDPDALGLDDDDDDPVLDDDDDDDDDDEVAAPARKPGDDDDEEDDDEIEADLDAILKDRLDAGDDEEDDDEEEGDTPKPKKAVAKNPEEVPAKAEDERTCESCWLIKPLIQFPDKGVFCVDCA